jgi:hypothetical protein
MMFPNLNNLWGNLPKEDRILIVCLVRICLCREPVGEDG